MFEGLKKWWKRECEGDAILFRPQPPENRTELTPKKPMAEEMRQSTYIAIEDKARREEIERKKEAEYIKVNTINKTRDFYLETIENIKRNSADGLFEYRVSRLHCGSWIYVGADIAVVFENLRTKDGFTVKEHPDNGGFGDPTAYTISW